MGQVKVSIIMPVLNGLPYFRQALDSVRQQTLQEIEILVVDAGSTDGTQAYVRACMQDDLRIQLLQADRKSMGYQYNLGMRQAQGEYIGFCESDDYVAVDMFQRLYAVAVGHGCPDCVKADFYMFFDKDGREVDLRFTVLTIERFDLYGKLVHTADDASAIWTRNGNMWNGIYNRSFLQQHEIWYAETPGAAFQDYSFILQVFLQAGSWFFVPEAYYHYRRDNPTSSIYKPQSFRFILQQGIFQLDYLEQHQELKRLYGAMLLEVFVQWLFYPYAQAVCTGSNTAFMEEITGLQRKAVAFFHSMTGAQRSAVRSRDALLFLYAPDLFQKYAVAYFEIDQKALHSSWRFIEKEPMLVLFGAGERGHWLATALERNNYAGQFVFCDNQLARQGTEILGHAVYSVDEAVRHYPQAAFLISTVRFFYVMRQQLLEDGVALERILLLDHFQPHSATVANWRC